MPVLDSECRSQGQPARVLAEEEDFIDKTEIKT